MSGDVMGSNAGGRVLWAPSSGAVRRWRSGLAAALALALASCATPAPSVDLSLPGRALPVVDGRIYPVTWRALEVEPVVFAPGQTELTEEQQARVASLVEELRAEEGMLVAVGFSRDGLSEDHTRVLAEARALLVRQALVIGGLERERIQTVAVGRLGPPGWPGSERPPSADAGGWVQFSEVLVPLAAWMAMAIDEAGSGALDDGSWLEEQEW